MPTEHLDTFDEKLKASFERIVKEGIDLERMAMIINRDQRQVRVRTLCDCTSFPFTSSAYK